MRYPERLTSTSNFPSDCAAVTNMLCVLVYSSVRCANGKQRSGRTWQFQLPELVVVVGGGGGAGCGVLVCVNGEGTGASWKRLTGIEEGQEPDLTGTY